MHAQGRHHLDQHAPERTGHPRRGGLFAQRFRHHAALRPTGWWVWAQKALGLRVPSAKWFTPLQFQNTLAKATATHNKQEHPCSVTCWSAPTTLSAPAPFTTRCWVFWAYQ